MDSSRFAALIYQAMMVAGIDTGDVEVKLPEQDWMRLATGFGRGSLDCRGDIPHGELTAYGIRFVCDVGVPPDAIIPLPLPPVSRQMKAMDELIRQSNAEIRRLTELPASMLGGMGGAPKPEPYRGQECDFVVFDEAADITQEMMSTTLANMRPGSVTWVDFDPASPLGPRTDLNVSGAINPTGLRYPDGGFPPPEPPNQKPYANAFDVIKAMIEGGEDGGG